jgi:hypothetical protein
MPWAASQVAWAGPGVLDVLVVPASRRRREAGRHCGLRGPYAGEGYRAAGVHLAGLGGRVRGGQPISTVRRCRKDHPAARCITGLLSLSLRPGTTGSEGGGAGPLGNGSGKRHGRTLCGCRPGYGGDGVVSPGGDGGGSGRGGDGGTGHGRVIRDCRRGDASAVAGRLAAGAQPQETRARGTARAMMTAPTRKAWV